MEELNQEELNLSSGGYWNHVLTYMTLLDLAHDIGRGLGDGFYDGVHSPQIPQFSLSRHWSAFSTSYLKFLKRPSL